MDISKLQMIMIVNDDEDQMVEIVQTISVFLTFTDGRTNFFCTKNLKFLTSRP